MACHSPLGHCVKITPIFILALCKTCYSGHHISYHACSLICHTLYIWLSGPTWIFLITGHSSSFVIGSWWLLYSPQFTDILRILRTPGPNIVFEVYLCPRTETLEPEKKGIKKCFLVISYWIFHFICSLWVHALPWPRCSGRDRYCSEAAGVCCTFHPSNSWLFLGQGDTLQWHCPCHVAGPFVSLITGNRMVLTMLM